MKLIRLSGFACVLALSFSGTAAPAPVPAGAKDSPERELARLTGKWKVVSRVQAGVELVAGQNVQEMVVVFKKDGTFGWVGGSETLGKISLIDPSKKPKEVDYLFNEGGNKGKTQKGLYKLEGDTFTDCCTPPGEDRPTEFTSTKENKYEIMVFERVKQKD